MIYKNSNVVQAMDRDLDYAIRHPSSRGDERSTTLADLAQAISQRKAGWLVVNATWCAIKLGQARKYFEIGVIGHWS